MQKSNKPLNPIKVCEDTFCKEYSKKTMKLSRAIIEIITSNNRLKNLDEKTQIKINKKIKIIEDSLKSKKFINESMKACKSAFCNPTCKGTIFQNNEFPKELEKKYSKKKDGIITIEYLKELRDSLFDGKKTIIKDGFYIYLKKIKKLKKDGAISGCAIMSI